MWNKAKIMRMAERALKRTEAYLKNRSDSNDPESNYQLDYVLAKGGKSAPGAAVAYAHYLDEIISFDPLKDDDNTQSVWHWTFNFDGDLFERLAQGYDLVGMSLEAHCAAWNEIEESHDSGGINSPKGMQQYLNYCKRNGVTAELLHKELQYDGMDAMTLYDKSAVREKAHHDRER